MAKKRSAAKAKARGGTRATPVRAAKRAAKVARAERRSSPTPDPVAPPVGGAGAGAGGTFRVIHVLSDSTGNLARHMLTAFLTQFPPQAFEVRVRNFLRTEAEVDRAMESVAADRGIVLHAVVSDPAKRRIAGHCARLGVPCRDLTGDFVGFLASNGGVTPGQDPDRLHHVDDTYRRRIEAVEFAMAHDDGLGLETLHQADCVLVGVSRTSKTPTTIYLSQQGFLAGNVALAMEVQPPKELLALPREKVAALVIDPSVLTDIRTHRHGEWRMGATSYNDPDHVTREIEWSRRLFRQQGWRVIDVTNQAIEETAARIVEVLRLSRPSV